MSQPIGCLLPDTLLTPDTLLEPFGYACQPVVDYGPGGGGFGAEMSDGFLKRYEPRYRSSLRKQASPRKQKA